MRLTASEPGRKNTVTFMGLTWDTIEDPTWDPKGDRLPKGMWEYLHREEPWASWCKRFDAYLLENYKKFRK